MAISRYRSVKILDNAYFASSDSPVIDATTIPTFTIRLSETDRLDSLAFKYLGSGEYWWVLAELNNIEWAFDLTPGELLRIPLDVNDVLKYF